MERLPHHNSNGMLLHINHPSQLLGIREDQKKEFKTIINNIMVLKSQLFAYHHTDTKNFHYYVKELYKEIDRTISLIKEDSNWLEPYLYCLLTNPINKVVEDITVMAPRSRHKAMNILISNQMRMNKLYENLIANY